MSDIAIMPLEVSGEEKALGIISAEYANWGRTMIVKLLTVDHYEAVGTYTVGSSDNPLPVRIAIARSNAARRLQTALERRRLA